MQTIFKLKGTVLSVWEGGARVTTGMGDVFVPIRLVDPRIVWRAEIVLEATSSDRKPRSKKERISPFIAERILAVQAPAPLPPPAEVYARVDWFDYKKGRGFVRLLSEHPFEADSAFLPGSVVKGLKPQKNDAVRVMVELTPRGLLVTALDFGGRITAIVEKLERGSKATSEPAARIISNPDGTNVASGAMVPVFGGWED